MRRDYMVFRRTERFSDPFSSLNYRDSYEIVLNDGSVFPVWIDNRPGLKKK